MDSACCLNCKQAGHCLLSCPVQCATARTGSLDAGARPTHGRCGASDARTFSGAPTTRSRTRVCGLATEEVEETRKGPGARAEMERRQGKEGPGAPPLLRGSD
eukprot:142211-Rhodomonas_salina.1